MSRKLSILGIALTAAYFLLLYFAFQGRAIEILLMAPNEIGDLLAGAFGPLAILWLILGFFQQGIELRQNTDALKLQEEALRAQVSELNASVEQQRQLVEISRKQMEAELETIRIDRERQRKAAQPKFVFHGCGGSRNGQECTYSSAIKNMGSAVTNVAFQLQPELKYQSIIFVHSWDSGEQRRFEWRYHTELAEEVTNLRISYIDAAGIPGESNFTLVPDMQSDWRSVSFTENC